jgi:DNA polymerase I-like protein with 3'-5' exonuclease and polymerase domains
VHDELIFEVRDDKKTIDKVREVVKIAMQGVNHGTHGEDIPLIVDGKVGKNWGSMS